MRITLTWLRLEVRRRWRSLLVLALLVALATATVLAAAAGARRGQTAFDRLWASTLPATVTVLPNQPGFDWAKIRALPEVAALSEFPVVFGFGLDCCPGASTGFPPADDQFTTTIERPVMMAGRLFNPDRVDEVVVTPQFAATYHKGVGDTLTLHLASPQQVNPDYDGSSGPPRGPGSWPASSGWAARPGVGDRGRTRPEGRRARLARLVPPLPGQHHGHQRTAYINALVRLKGGDAAIPAFRADLARVTGRSDIDVWNNREFFGGPSHGSPGTRPPACSPSPWRRWWPRSS